MGVMRVLGIDPGIARVGYGVVDVVGSQLRPITYGCIETTADTPLERRLQQVYRRVLALLEQYAPSVVAVEELFFNRNVTTAFTVGQARGVVLLAAAEHDTPLCEYTPMQVKQAVTGYGRADKNQIQQMVKILLGLSEIPKPDDAADALAIAIAHGHAAPMRALEETTDTSKRTGWTLERRGRR